MPGKTFARKSGRLKGRNEKSKARTRQPDASRSTWNRNEKDRGYRENRENRENREYQGLGENEKLAARQEDAKEADRRRKEKEEARRQLEARRRRKEQNIREAKEAAANRVSYVRKPLAKRSLFGIGFLAAAILLGVLGVRGAVVTQGQAELSSAAMVLCSMVLTVVALWYGGISFLEKEKNYILARVCIGIGGILLIAWVAMVVMGNT